MKFLLSSQKYRMYLFSIVFLFSSFFSFAFSQMTDPFQRVKWKLETEQFQEALDLLNGYNNILEPFLWEFHKLKGKSLEGIGKPIEAIEQYELSVRYRKEQPDVFLSVANLSHSTKNLQKEFNFLRLYLALEEFDKEKRYRAMVLSSRLGDFRYFKYSAKLLDISKEKLHNDYNELEELLKKKSYTELEKSSRLRLLDSPMDETLHRYLHASLFFQKEKEDLYEEVLIDTAVIFYLNPIYSNRLAEYYFQKQKYIHSLNVLRRIYILELKQKGIELNQDVLYLFRQIYFRTNQQQDYYAIGALLQAMKNKSNLTIKKVDNIYYQHPNREVILMGMWISQKENNQAKYNLYKDLLNKRDAKNEYKEFVNILTPFQFENLDLD